MARNQQFAAWLAERVLQVADAAREVAGIDVPEPGLAPMPAARWSMAGVVFAESVIR